LSHFDRETGISAFSSIEKGRRRVFVAGYILVYTNGTLTRLIEVS
jgi:hypothetical protein